MLYSQCSCCGKTFDAKDKNYLFCSNSCEKDHDIFQMNVTQTYLLKRKKAELVPDHMLFEPTIIITKMECSM